MREKYLRELHANEIVLLAYYIAAINIEAAYHGLVGGQYEPFEGIVLTDTFQSSEKDDSMDEVIFPQNNARLVRQKQADITVIMANPPYSVGQTSENDDNKNLEYPMLDEAIRRTYAKKSSAVLKTSLYDSYVRAFRWASNRIGERGVICFVSNGSYIDTNTFDGFRKGLAEEFSVVYCFNLRGNARTSGELRRRERDNVFGQGSRTPVAITLLVKNPATSGPCKIRYHDIGDYLTREEKLSIIGEFASIERVPWRDIEPNSVADWINQRDEAFGAFQPLGDKKGGPVAPFFEVYSAGVKTNRDAWAYNFSSADVLMNMRRMVDFYNSQVEKFGTLRPQEDIGSDIEITARLIDRDPQKISWSQELINDLQLGRRAEIRDDKAIQSMYRPFCKQWLYLDRQLNNRVYQIPRIFPTPNHPNLVIHANSGDARRPFSALITDVIPDLHLHDMGQGFPLYYYEEAADPSLFLSEEILNGYTRHDSITDSTLTGYQKRYGNKVVKEDIFYYVYGVLHSPEYRELYAADLKKMIPRIPMVSDFWAFSRAGRELGEWHLDYETVDPWPLDGLPAANTPAEYFRVEKMRFAGSGRNVDRSTIVFNRHITLRGIPEDSYGYEVNGKSAIEWIMDRYEVKIDKDSGIRNDPNLWSDDPRYIVDLIARMVRVSLETIRIVGGLPPIG